MISDNIECRSYENVNTGYRYSDHDPVVIKFRLKDEEMIDELNQLLSSNDDTTADNSASTDTTTAENTENN